LPDVDLAVEGAGKVIPALASQIVKNLETRNPENPHESGLFRGFLASRFAFLVRKNFASAKSDFEKIVSAGRRNQHARRVRYPKRICENMRNLSIMQKCRIALHSRSGI
jgi:hypothetical protein